MGELAASWQGWETVVPLAGHHLFHLSQITPKDGLWAKAHGARVLCLLALCTPRAPELSTRALMSFAYHSPPALACWPGNPRRFNDAAGWFLVERTRTLELCRLWCDFKKQINIV